MEVMLKFIQNKNGFISLTLSQIGLFIAVAVLLAAVFNFVFLNDWGKKEEIETIANGLSSHIDGMDTCFFDNKTKYFFKENDFEYNVKISTEYIVVESESGWFNDEEIRVTKRLLTNVLPRDNRFRWKTGDELHSYLKRKYIFSGTVDDPISTDFFNIPPIPYVSVVKTYILLEKMSTKDRLTRDPIEIDTDKPVFVEKVYIYYDDNADGRWESEVDTREDLLLLYQL
jgi:hypothetical protein